MFRHLRAKIGELTRKLSGGEEEKQQPKPGVAEKTLALLRGEVVLDESRLEELLGEFEIALLESDVALDVAEKIVSDLKRSLLGKKFRRSEVEQAVRASLERSLREVLELPAVSLEEAIRAKEEKPFVMLFVGINGTGKTTTIAKVAKRLLDRGFTCVFAASDTYRAGAIEQLERHAERLGVKLIKHSRGADPAAVAYDAVEHARARGKDVVLIDTAGRMETNVNLLEEMKKIARVAKPDLVIFVGDALTGNAAVEQAERFNSAVSIDGVILTKADADAKGGAAISIAHAIRKPVLFLGTGQGYDDLVEFSADWLIKEVLG
ncbi:MAG: signal recognition particle-docking protein FtsY [Euryarchaeota archaeon]|nr:signal recognition particle-docking protein FtsY [Euryarchaeota archaeon]